jgi:hypothetical protein
MKLPWTKPQYQLVLEFFAKDMSDYDRLVALELDLNDKLRTGEIDGHDMGGGVFNLFVITTSPEKSFKEIMEYLASASDVPSASGYRLIEGEAYTRLWTSNDPSPFELH